MEIREYDCSIINEMHSKHMEYLQINFQRKEDLLDAAKEVGKQYYHVIYKVETTYCLFIPFDANDKRVLEWGTAHNMGIDLCKRYNSNLFIISFEEENWESDELVCWYCDYNADGIRI